MDDFLYDGYEHAVVLPLRRTPRPRNGFVIELFLLIVAIVLAVLAFPELERLVNPDARARYDAQQAAKVQERQEKERREVEDRERRERRRDDLQRAFRELLSDLGTAAEYAGYGLILAGGLWGVGKLLVWVANEERQARLEEGTLQTEEARQAQRETLLALARDNAMLAHQAAQARLELRGMARDARHAQYRAQYRREQLQRAHTAAAQRRAQRHPYYRLQQPQLERLRVATQRGEQERGRKAPGAPPDNGHNGRH